MTSLITIKSVLCCVLHHDGKNRHSWYYGITHISGYIVRLESRTFRSYRRTIYIVLYVKMRPIAPDRVAWSVDWSSVCLSQSWTLQKRLNWSRSNGISIGSDFGWGSRSPWERAILGKRRPIIGSAGRSAVSPAKRLKRSRCRLVCELGGPKQPSIKWKCRCPKGKGHF